MTNYNDLNPNNVQLRAANMLKSFGIEENEIEKGGIGSGKYIHHKNKSEEENQNNKIDYDLPTLINEGWKDTAPHKTVLVKDFGIKKMSELQGNSSLDKAMKSAAKASSKNKVAYIFDKSTNKSFPINKYLLLPNIVYYHISADTDNVHVKAFKLGDKFKIGENK